MTNRCCIYSIACRKLKRRIKDEVHQHNYIVMTAFRRRQVLLLSKRSVQTAAGNSLNTLLVLIRASVMVVAA